MSVDRRPNGRYRVRWRDNDGKQRSKHFRRKAEADRYDSMIQADLVRVRVIT